MLQGKVLTGFPIPLDFEWQPRRYMLGGYYPVVCKTIKHNTFYYTNKTIFIAICNWSLKMHMLNNTVHNKYKYEGI